jgi:hypothetical protein
VCFTQNLDRQVSRPARSSQFATILSDDDNIRVGKSGAIVFKDRQYSLVVRFLQDIVLLKAPVQFNDRLYNRVYRRLTCLLRNETFP